MENLKEKAKIYLDYFCNELNERSVGSEGNRQATKYFKNIIKKLNWNTITPEFNAIDWIDNGANLIINQDKFNILVSPYSLGCDINAELVSASNINELETLEAKNKIIFLFGNITKEQLMPKNFVFYNPDEHRKIISLLERSGAKAIICATGKNPALAGGVYPFPLIEDGDFNIPSVYMKDTEGDKLKKYIGNKIHLRSQSQRIQVKGYNVISNKPGTKKTKIVITAHIDAKKGTPGAIDNATGVIILLILSELLQDYSGDNGIEIVAFNGEDYYAVSGQMNYITNNINEFKDIILNINIDGAGYKDGKSAFSFHNLPENIENNINNIINEFPNIIQGDKWYQGDHSIFIQYNVPALAVSSDWFIKNMEVQDVTHTPKDNVSIVNIDKIIEIAIALKKIVEQIE